MPKINYSRIKFLVNIAKHKVFIFVAILLLVFTLVQTGVNALQDFHNANQVRKNLISQLATVQNFCFQDYSEKVSNVCISSLGGVSLILDTETAFDSSELAYLWQIAVEAKNVSFINAISLEPNTKLKNLEFSKKLLAVFYPKFADKISKVKNMEDLKILFNEQYAKL